MVKTALLLALKFRLFVSLWQEREEFEDFYRSQTFHESKAKSQEREDNLKAGFLCYCRFSWLGSYHTWLQKVRCLLLLSSSPLG